MNRAILAGWFLLTKNTVMKPFLRVILQFQATAADTGYRGMLFPAIHPDHGFHNEEFPLIMRKEKDHFRFGLTAMTKKG